MVKYSPYLAVYWAGVISGGSGSGAGVVKPALYWQTTYGDFGVIDCGPYKILERQLRGCGGITRHAAQHALFNYCFIP